MKKIAVTLLLMAIVTGSFAADWATSEGSCFAKGDKNISAGLSMSLIGFYGSFEYAVHDAISAGAGFGYNGHNYNSIFYSIDYRENYLPIVARGTFHPFNLAVLADKIKIREKLDTYIGLNVGWRVGWQSSNSTTYFNDNISNFIFRERIGARFYPTSKMYVFAEENGGVYGWLSAGAGLKF